MKIKYRKNDNYNVLLSIMDINSYKTVSIKKKVEQMIKNEERDENMVYDIIDIKTYEYNETQIRIQVAYAIIKE